MKFAAKLVDGAARIAFRALLLWRCPHREQIRVRREGRLGTECLRCLRFFPLVRRELSPVAVRMEHRQANAIELRAPREGQKGYALEITYGAARSEFRTFLKEAANG
jgi:hypothetical protein